MRLSTWGWVIEYGIMALIIVALVFGFFALRAQDRLWRWQDHRDARRGRAAEENGRRMDGAG